MSSGPCLCGDPYCPSCGTPGEAEMLGAIDGALAIFHNAKLTPGEIIVAANIGTQAVLAGRGMVEEALKEKASNVTERILRGGATVYGERLW